MIKESDLPVLNQLVVNLEKSFKILKESYQRRDSGKFNETKKTILQTQKKIFDMTQEQKQK